MTLTKIMLLLLCLFTSIVSRADYSDSILVPKQEMGFAKEYLQAFLDQDFDFILENSDQAITGKLTKQSLLETRNLFPLSQVISAKLIGSNVHMTDDTWQGTFNFEYEFKSEAVTELKPEWAVFTIRVVKEDSKLRTLAYRFTRTIASQAEINGFELVGKSALYYLVLAATVLVFLFILVTLVVCIKTPIPRRKWIWVLFVLGGIGTFSLNWTTGAYTLKLIELRLFGVGFGASSEYSPWMISVSFPLGAIIFWLMRASFIRQTQQKQAQFLDAAAQDSLMENEEESASQITLNK